MAEIRLNDFHITENGFLPCVSPLSYLDNTYYSPWESIAQNLSSFIRLRSLRQMVKQLPILTVEHLYSEREWRRAHTLLTFIAHAYVWGGDEPEEVLPASIAIPLLYTAQHVELPPVLTCATVNLWNYTLKGASLTNPEDIEIHTTFTGTESEAWFLAVGTAIEAKGAHLIQPLIDALAAARSKNSVVITASLIQLARSVDEMTSILGRIPERCDPMIFCHQIRPFYAGSKGVTKAGLPRGVFYDEGQGRGQWLQLQGGSNGQSALLQLFDMALGLGYNKTDDPARKRDGYFHDTRECTPGPHRRFLAVVGDLSNIRLLVLEQKSYIHPTDEQVEMGKAYTAATEALARFRSKHIQIVTRFITMPLRRDWHGSQESIALPELLPSGLRDNASYGTAGTTMLRFLKRLRDETIVAGKLTEPAYQCSDTPSTGS